MSGAVCSGDEMGQGVLATDRSFIKRKAPIIGRYDLACAHADVCTENIDTVAPTHFTPTLLSACMEARSFLTREDERFAKVL